MSRAHPPLGAGLLELGHELGAAVDREGPNPEGHTGGHGIEDRESGPALALGEREDVLAAHHVAGGELLEDPARLGTGGKRVALDEVARARAPEACGLRTA